MTPVADPALGASAACCEAITRAQARNFYHGLKLLPEPKRSQMYALYAYMRMLDDIADEDDGRDRARRLADLESWRRLTHDAFEGRLPDDPPTGPGGADIWPAFADLVGRCSIPRKVFDDAIAGQARDLGTPRFETFDELEDYCYQVAGTVGVASVHVWGYTGGADTIELAAHRGTAFQLTNILRDLREDAAAGRTYLPRQELADAGVTPEDLRAGRVTTGFVALVGRQVARAEAFYERSAPLDPRVDADSRPTLVAMTDIYRGLLKKIARDPGRVLRERVSLSLPDKLWIAWRAKRSMRKARV
ncbi:MAG TPA: phytoene/squalene synthase family protein [Humisphaera sp.]